jgi:hypothetical protein
MHCSHELLGCTYTAHRSLATESAPSGYCRPELPSRTGCGVSIAKEWVG